MAIETFFHLGFFPLGLRVLDTFLSFCCMKELGDGFGCVDFARLFISCGKLQLSPLEHCPLAFQLPTISRTSLFPLFRPLILDHGACFKISISGTKILISNFLFDTSFHHRLQSVIVRSYFLLMNLQVVQFQHGLECLRLSHS